MLTSAYQPQPGRFLISEPFMGDPNFSRTVVLLVEHNEEGSLGFVLNRQLENSLQQLVEDMPPFDAPIFLGGPVEQNTLHFIHQLDYIPGAREVIPGLFWSGDFNFIKDKIEEKKIKPEELLFFVGYSGWGPGQLKEELDRKSWIIAPENPTFVFAKDQENLWQDLLRSMGSKYKVISNYPVDPRLN